MIEQINVPPLIGLGPIHASTLKEGMKKTEAEDLKKKIEAAGGKIELK